MMNDLLQSSLTWVAGLGPWGPAALAGLYVVACVLFLPGWILSLGAGALFGPLVGTVAVSAGATLGSAAAFLIGRHVARDWVARRLAGFPAFKTIDDAVSAQGWKIVLLTRLSPVFPFNLLNYGYGLTGVRLRSYVIASWAGMLPGTITYVYLGSLVRNLAELGHGHARTPAEWILYGVGLAATLAVTVVVTRIARAALGRTLPAGRPA